MSQSRKELKGILMSVDTELEGFAEALARCGTKEKVVGTPEKPYTLIVSDPLSDEDIYELYGEIFERGTHKKVELLEKFIQTHHPVFDINKAMGQIRLPCLVETIKTLRERGGEEKHGAELKNLERNLLLRLRENIIHSARQYFKVNKSRFWSLHHRDYENKTTTFINNVNPSRTLEEFVEAIRKEIASENNAGEADASLKDDIKVREHSLSNFLLETITAPENRHAYALALRIDEKDMPEFNKKFSKKERGEALRQLGLLKSDEIVSGLHLGNEWPTVRR